MCYQCPNLQTITFKSSLTTTINDRAFQSWSELRSIAFVEGMKTIGDYAFSNKGIRTLTIPHSVTTIGNSSNEECRTMTTIPILNWINNNVK